MEQSVQSNFRPIKVALRGGSPCEFRYLSCDNILQVIGRILEIA
jgi:hypothetical protein